MEHGAVIFGIQMQRETRCSTSSSASVFHLSHLAVAVREWCTAAGEIYHPQLTKTSKKQHCLEGSAHFMQVGYSRLNFFGGDAVALLPLLAASPPPPVLMGADGVPIQVSAADACG